MPDYVRPTNWIIAGSIGPFDEHVELVAVVAARIDRHASTPTLSDFVDLSWRVDDGVLSWQVPEGEFRIFTLCQNDTRHNLLASAFPGARESAPVLDHLHSGGVQEYIAKLGEPWLRGLAPYKPDAFFIDSFEMIGELPWSSQFRERFRVMHGYDVTPYLPLLFRAHGESKYLNMIIEPSPAYQSADGAAPASREDYELTREHSFREAFVLPLRHWLHDQGVKLRLQAHGGYGDYLDTYQLADIPESEGLFAGGSGDFLRLAASAGHVAGRDFISSETFVTIAFDFDAWTPTITTTSPARPLPSGINRLIYHGYAYHRPLASTR